MLSVFFIILMLLCMVWFIVSLIRCFLKKGKVRQSILAGIFAAIFFILICAINIRNYVIDKWFYDLRTDIMNAHNQVVDIDYSFGWADLSIFVDLEDGDTIDDLYNPAVSIFNSMADYFLNNNGIQESQNSWAKREAGKYTAIIISFYERGNEYSFISFESGYFTDGLQKDINNYHIWQKEYKEGIEDVVPPIAITQTRKF